MPTLQILKIFHASFRIPKLLILSTSAELIIQQRAGVKAQVGEGFDFEFVPPALAIGSNLL